MKNQGNIIFVRELLRRIGLLSGNTIEVSGNVQIPCPFASVNKGHKRGVDRHPSFGVKILDDGRFAYHCFTCGVKGDSIIRFIQELKDSEIIDSEIDAYELQNSLNIPIPKYNEYNFSSKSNRKLIPVWKLEEENENENSLEIFYKYNIEKRGLTKRLISLFGLQPNRQGENSMFFPVYSIDMDYLGYVYHKIGKKYVNKIFTAEDTLYLEWLISGKIGIVVEGMYDALSGYKYLEEANKLDTYSIVGAFGAEIGMGQIKKLSRYFSTIIVMGDNDIAGNKMEQQIGRILRHKTPVLRAKYRGHDPDSIDKEEFIEAIENADFIEIQEQKRTKKYKK